MKVIFLDMDGVLNSVEDWIEAKIYPEHTCNSGLSVISRAKMAMLQNIIEETGAKIVLSSSWRHMYSLDEMHAKFVQRGWKLPRETFIDVTPNLRSGFRGHEVKQWLDLNRGKYDIENFVIIDDDSDFQYELQPHFVHTQGKIGMTFDDMELVISKLNNTPLIVQPFMCSRGHEPSSSLLKEIAADLGLPINDPHLYHDVMHKVRLAHDKIVTHYDDQEKQNG